MSDSLRKGAVSGSGKAPSSPPAPSGGNGSRGAVPGEGKVPANPPNPSSNQGSDEGKG